jgi:Cu/Ag efflux protein CusF
MNKPIPTLVASLLLCVFALPISAQKQSNDSSTAITETAPGKGTIAETRTVVATVEQVDAAKRQVTLKGPRGRVFPLTLGPDVRNLDQVKVGDRVVVQYVEALSLTLKKGGKELRSSTQVSDAVRAPAGDRPGGAVGEQITVTADVVGVNAKTHMVRLRGPERTVELYIRDPAQLKLIKVGDQVDAVYTQAVALSVEPAPAAKK